jgi:uncharacterized membrane protein
MRRGRPQFWRIGAIVIAAVAIVGVVVLLYLNGFLGPTPYGSRSNYPLFGDFLVLFLVVWLGFFLLRISFWSARVRARQGGYGGPRRGPDPAVVIARQRYARGEITREQFDQIMTDLGRRGRGPGGPLSGA